MAGVGGKDQVYRVERVDGRRLRLQGEGKKLSGWAPADRVVAVAADPPADPAVRRTGARLPGPFGTVVTTAVRYVRSEAALRRAYAAMDRTDLDGAIAACTDAIGVDPDCQEAYAIRGGAWAMKNQMPRAIPDLTEAIRLDPEDASAYSGRGIA